MFNQLEYQSVILAGLLHDIGKFLQCGLAPKPGVIEKHPSISEKFVSDFSECFNKVADITLLKTLMQRHHELSDFSGELRVQGISDQHARTLAYLVSKADNLSSAERGPGLEQWEDYNAVPLASVFGKVRLDSTKEPTILHHRLVSLGNIDSLRDIFPSEFDQYDTNEMNKQVQAFGSDFHRLLDHLDIANFDCVCTHLLGILQKYTWCMPSNTQEKVPDVSLYDHLKTTAAIAACLYKYHTEKDALDEKHVQVDENRFHIVVGDLSGIQDYIFDIATTGAGGVAKRLRARSLFVQLLIEAVAYKLLRKLNLPLTNVIMFSGGKFHCLLPNTSEAATAVKEIQHEVDHWLLKHLNGELALNIGGFTFGDSGFTAKSNGPGGFGTVVARSAETLSRRKIRRFADALTTAEGWCEDAFVLKVAFKGQNECQSCGKFPRVDDPELCAHCQLDRSTGTNLPKAKYIAFFANENDGNIPLAGHSASLLRETKELPGNAYLVLKLNDADLTEIASRPALPKYVTNHVALHPDCNTCQSKNRCKETVDASGYGDIATFGCMASRSSGRPLLGFLKVDADRMGQVFSFGLKREQDKDSQGFDTISRLSTLSRQLDNFFSGWVQFLAEKEFPECYAVFSGGDDLFFVGPWDKIIALGERIEQDFRKLTANADMTLSAGIIMVQSRYPIARASEKVETALEKSKEKGRDRLTLLGSSLSWSEWREVKNEWDRLQPHLDKISSAFLYALLRYGDMWLRFKGGDVLGLRFQPLLAYNIARNINPRQTPEIYQWARQLISAAPKDSRQEFVLDHLKFIALLLLMSKKGSS